MKIEEAKLYEALQSWAWAKLIQEIGAEKAGQLISYSWLYRGLADLEVPQKQRERMFEAFDVQTLPQSNQLLVRNRCQDNEDRVSSLIASRIEAMKSVVGMERDLIMSLVDEAGE